MFRIRDGIEADALNLFKLYHAEGWTSFSQNKMTSLLVGSSYLVVEGNGEIVAFARYLTDGVLTTFVAEILVAPDFRGQGIGKMLVDEIHQRTMGTRLELISEADDFYEYLGFRKVGQGYRLT